jgi:nitric oxide reductase subunit B
MSERPASYKRLWGLFAFVVLASFAVLGGFGFRIASEAPPVPGRVVAGGKVLFDGDLIREGQNVWQSMGGMQVGSVWGHGAYVAPDWSADWLHRELVFVLDRWAAGRGARDYGVSASTYETQNASPHGKCQDL